MMKILRHLLIPSAVAALAPQAWAQTLDYSVAGPYEVAIGVSHGCTLYAPADPGAGGDLHPVILWGNGTGVTPDYYDAGLRHWASWGFVVAAANTRKAGTGEQMLRCLDALTEANERPFNSFYQALDLQHVGSSGHSQGGGGTIMVGADLRISTTAPMMPFTSDLGHDPAVWDAQQGPMFMMSGGRDFLAPIPSEQYPVYLAVDVPLFWGIRLDAYHSSALGGFDPLAGPSTAWFLWQLTGDSEAARYFSGDDCVLCVDPEWLVIKKGF